ncbi:hypothetical protein KKC45_03960 [Patescibacteria group bacterium]|nr:hypothetical protein [Patescibacteria group bacterium]
MSGKVKIITFDIIAGTTIADFLETVAIHNSNASPVKISFLLIWSPSSLDYFFEGALGCEFSLRELAPFPICIKKLLEGESAFLYNLDSCHVLPDAKIFKKE